MADINAECEQQQILAYRQTNLKKRKKKWGKLLLVYQAGHLTTHRVVHA